MVGVLIDLYAAVQLLVKNIFLVKVTQEKSLTHSIQMAHFWTHLHAFPAE